MEIAQEDFQRKDRSKEISVAIAITYMALLAR